jgi:hypothetical protein
VSLQDDLTLIRESLEDLCPNEEMGNEIARKFGLTETYLKRDALAALERVAEHMALIEARR